MISQQECPCFATWACDLLGLAARPPARKAWRRKVQYRDSSLHREAANIVSLVTGFPSLVVLCMHAVRRIGGDCGI